MEIADIVGRFKARGILHATCRGENSCHAVSVIRLPVDIACKYPRSQKGQSCDRGQGVASRVFGLVYDVA